MDSGEKLLIDDKSRYNKGQSVLRDDSVIELRGADNTVDIGDNVKGRLSVSVIGNNNKIIIADNVFMISCLQIAIRLNGSTITIGPDCTFQGLVRLSSHEASSITIGADCMFSSDITASTSDVHAIFDADNVRINPAQPIVIGDHVWVGNGVKLLKGATVGSGSVIGMSSLVTRGQYPENCIIAGTPARVVRKDIHWTRHLP
ncbi:acyltransferase [Methylovulum psychrotolerans]|uniref:acyltransferase n=1 Tax=Methylovulum psychrotolerans TaxID=1704499 RepID=UPI001BFFCF91|nr:acyltransferase [Methylovulum psychrotolerans]MBT9097488.1 acyltransferase [Methylovulum psychrotolerans]